MYFIFYLASSIDCQFHGVEIVVCLLAIFLENRTVSVKAGEMAQWDTVLAVQMRPEFRSPKTHIVRALLW